MSLRREAAPARVASLVLSPDDLSGPSRSGGSGAPLCLLTKCRGEMPMSSSSARTIGVAPAICTALRCASMRLIALSSAPAQAKSIRSTSLMSIGITARPDANSEIRPSCGTADPAMIPDQRSTSPRRSHRRHSPQPRSRRPPGRHRRRLPRWRRQPNVTAYSTARSEGRMLAHCRARATGATHLATVAPFTAASSAGFNFSARWSCNGSFLRRASPSAARRAERHRRRIRHRRHVDAGPAVARHGTLEAHEVRRTAAVSLPVSPM